MHHEPGKGEEVWLRAFSLSLIRDYFSYKTLVTWPDSICFNKTWRVSGVTQQLKNTVAFCASVPISGDLENDFLWLKFILFEFKKVLTVDALIAKLTFSGIFAVLFPTAFNV